MTSSDMTRLLRLLPLAALLFASMAAQANEGAWYVAPSIAYTDDDGDRLIDDSLAGWQIQVGKEMSDRFLLEGLLGYHDIDGFPGQEHLELGVNAIRKFRPDSLFSPYVIGGVGYLRADVGLPDFGGSPAADTTENSATATAGLGFMVRFGDSPWSLRTEWRFRQAFGGDSLLDQVGTLGIQYSFGGSATPTPVAVSDTTPVVYADSDQDGVTDDRDKCPGTAAGAKVDFNGCEMHESVEFRNIYFGFDSDVVLATAGRILDESAAMMKRHPDVQLEIAGFADSRGPERYNLKLSERRAEAVRAHLVQAGVSADRLTVRGYGMSGSVATDLTASSLAENRRVELRIRNR
jgi:OOP family OmpA-OmpF porin